MGKGLMAPLPGIWTRTPSPTPWTGKWFLQDKTPFLSLYVLLSGDWLKKREMRMQGFFPCDRIRKIVPGISDKYPAIFAESWKCA